MAHFAELDSNNNVLRICVINNSDVDANGGDKSIQAENFVASITPYSENGVAWKQTSYSGSFRYNFAGINSTYNQNNDAFINPSPYPSWILNETTYEWGAPYPCPDGSTYYWNENDQQWELS
tara:strand:+ start:41 stop:406 length:366 start_codon:yes stop_codon:yes gene_type:complete